MSLRKSAHSVNNTKPSKYSSVAKQLIPTFIHLLQIQQILNQKYFCIKEFNRKSPNELTKTKFL